MYSDQVESSLTNTPLILTTARCHDDDSLTAFPLCHVTICHYTFDASLSHFVRHTLTHTEYEYAKFILLLSPVCLFVSSYSTGKAFDFKSGIILPFEWTCVSNVDTLQTPTQFMTSIPKYPPSSVFLSVLSEFLCWLFYFIFHSFFRFYVCIYSYIFADMLVSQWMGWSRMGSFRLVWVAMMFKYHLVRYILIF